MEQYFVYDHNNQELGICMFHVEPEIGDLFVAPKSLKEYTILKLNKATNECWVGPKKIPNKEEIWNSAQQAPSENF